MVSDTWLHAFRILTWITVIFCLPVSHRKRERSPVRVCSPWDFKHAGSGQHIPLHGDSGSGCQLGPGLIIRGPREVFLKHCVDPNEFQVPSCPSPILLGCKNVGFSFFHNCYYKSLCPTGFSSGCGICFSWTDSDSDLPLNSDQDRRGWLSLLSFSSTLFFLCVLRSYARNFLKNL